MAGRHVLLLLAVQSAGAWGPEGHELAARLAERLLDARVKARIAGILRPGESIVSVSGWADAIRGARQNTRTWHYVNVPVSRPDWDLARDCPAGDCVVARLTQFAGELRDPATSPRRRREALMFVVHFTADLHQPLHVADNGDEGGNRVPVSFFGRRTNLHALWDSGILGRMGSPEVLFQSLAREMSGRKTDEWSRGDPEQWARESRQASRDVAYGRLAHRGRKRTILLGQAYEHFAQPVTRVQLQKAGARMAALLEGALR
jgi:hypothetical protein